ncbi:S-layer homology domain-containing protein [Candidatus Formimonas warabiya]|uniref:SLH domain-containing protein n=1 Tax=Formimonas warabiya TaxID=1761012 RepID=A0A3G1KYY8_FORW1|nr:S-layer homology domain-containing protein [Candidatus Formimonas warabiya]ATW27569.1 hypothetical protein DCMF_24950 [Candidatus Formimonas warabiya]
MAEKNKIKRYCHWCLMVFLTLVLVLGALPPGARAADYLTATVEVEGSQVSASGATTPETDVTLLVLRTGDENKSYTDQTRSDKTGAFSFSFPMGEGNYQATFTSNGLTVQRTFTVKNSAAGTVTVRVEGASATLLDQVEVDILSGETTILEAIITALTQSRLEYEMANGLIHKIHGEEGWQWIVNGVGRMSLPGDVLKNGDGIVVVDDALWDPTLTRLELSADQVDVGKSFTATLTQGAGATPAAGQTVIFNNEEKVTDQNGQVSFTGSKAGNYYVTAETTGGLIRPVPAAITVGKPSGGPVTDNRISVQMRIEGYKGTLFDGTVVFDPNDYKKGSAYFIKDPDGTEHECSKPNVLLATIVAWNKGKIKDNSVTHDDNYVARMGGEEEFDFEKEHITCGWMVRVNDYMINKGVGAWPIEDGDEVVWYYGDLESYYGYIDVSPTSLDPGESITVKVTGKGNNVGTTGKSVKIADATVYVGKNEYPTDKNGEVTIPMPNSGTYKVYAEKVDKNSKNGKYYFPLLSRTEKVEVNVEGSGSGSSGTTLPAASVVEAAGQRVMAAGEITLSADQITVDQDKTSALVKAQDLSRALSSIEAEIAALKAGGTLSAEEIAALKKQVTLTVPENGTGTVEVVLEANATSLLKQANSLKIISEVANLEISAASLGIALGKEITFTARKVAYDTLEGKAQSQVPAGSVIVDLTLRAGSSTVKNFAEPVRVEIPYEGSVQNSDRITVFLLKEDGTVEPIGGIYDAASGRVRFLTDHFSKYFAKESVKQFTDLAKYPWAKDAVEIMAGKGIVGGKGEGIFDPGAPITRAEFAALITRMLHYRSEAKVPFSDVKAGQWYYADVAAAYAKGLISGKSAQSFDPAGQITRQEMAAIIAKVLQKNGFRGGKDTTLDNFKDQEKISSWARTAVAVTAEQGIVTGLGDGSFAPEQKATRAQAAVMLYRLYKLILKGDSGAV